MRIQRTRVAHPRDWEIFAAWGAGIVILAIVSAIGWAGIEMIR